MWRQWALPFHFAQPLLPSPARHRVRAGRSHTELFEEYLRERDAHDERVVALFTELLGEAHEA